MLLWMEACLCETLRRGEGGGEYMVKKMAIFVSMSALVLAMVVPTYAQTPGNSGHQGFFSGIASFFNGLFHHQNGSMMQGGPYPSGVVPSGRPLPSGMMYPNPSGQPSLMMMQEARLSGLVQAGKITEAQKTAIIAELQKVQDELKAWAQSQGISEAYVVGGGLGGGQGQEMMMQQQQGQQSGQQGQTQTQQSMQGRGMYGGQGGQGQGMMQQQGGQQVPPQQGQGKY